MKDDAVIKDNEAVYLINEQTYLHLRENIEGIGYEVFKKESPLPVEEGQISRGVLGDSQRRIEAVREYYLAEQQDADPALRFAAMRYLNKQNIAPSVENYEVLYRGNLPEGKRRVPQAELLEQLYQKFNFARPTDYHGHSLSVSDVIMLMMLYNTGSRLGLMQELRLMQCYLMPDETALRELSEGVIEKLRLMTDAQFAEVEFPMD